MQMSQAGGAVAFGETSERLGGGLRMETRVRLRLSMHGL